MCPFYNAWNAMIKRCYSQAHQLRSPTYVGCTVCAEWLRFSNFKAWMEQQDWKGKELDKDLLIKGNRVYSPDTCTFVDAMTNSFTIDSGAARGAYLIGVSFHKKSGRFSANCNNPLTGKRRHIGLFDDELSAHLAWKRKKHEIACQLASLQSDNRVAEALRVRYL